MCSIASSTEDHMADVKITAQKNGSYKVEGPIELQQPKVLYTFADPDLEALSSGQKIMVRIGLENEAIVNRVADFLAN